MYAQDADQVPTPATVDLKLEVVVIPVLDVDRAKHFCASMGWRLDADVTDGADWRVVQLTPPGSACSVLFGKGITTARPGSVQGTLLVVSDIEAARAELVGRGIAVSDVFHFQGGLHVDGTKGRVPGPDPEGGSYRTWPSFNDPDGNSWLLQEIKTRLPGRGFGLDVAILTDLLQEAIKRHGQYGPTAPKHDRAEWYAAYIVAREQGKSPAEAMTDGALHIERIHR